MKFKKLLNHRENTKEKCHPLESNPGRNRWEEVTIAVNLDGDHEGVHTCIKFHQNVHYLCIFQFVNHIYFKEKYMCLNYQ